MLGRPKPKVRAISVLAAEFMTIESDYFLIGEDWQLYLTRFSRAAKSVGLPKREADLLGVALNEMAENTAIHSQSPVPGLAGYHVAPGSAQFCVADVGVGILGSLRNCSVYQTVKTHREAIRLALHDGVSRFGPHQGGFGFGRVFKALVANWGDVRFRSGEACLTMSGVDLDADQGTEHFPPPLPGFQVSVTCRVRAPG